MKNTWYEVFVNVSDQTRTLSSFDTLKDARSFRNKIVKRGFFYIDSLLVDLADDSDIGIDKWKDRDNPVSFKSDYSKRVRNKK